MEPFDWLTGLAAAKSQPIRERQDYEVGTFKTNATFSTTFWNKVKRSTGENSNLWWFHQIFANAHVIFMPCRERKF